MSITDLKPRDVPAELRVKIERVMKKDNLSWRAAILFLAREVVSPSEATRAGQNFFAHRVVSP